MKKYKVFITVEETYSRIIDAKNFGDAESKAEEIRQEIETPAYPILHFDGDQGLKYGGEKITARVHPILEL